MIEIIINIIISIVVGYIIQLIIHEFGHYIGGILTGWKLLYIQFNKLIIRKTENIFKLELINEKNYECIMYPKSISQATGLYTLGGFMLNIITALIGIMLIIILNLNDIIFIYIWSFSAFGIGFLLINGIARINKVCNDKACYKIIRADPVSKKCHNMQFIIAKKLYEGHTYKDIGEENICITPEYVKDDIQAYQAILEYYYYLDINDEINMKKPLSKIKEICNISKNILSIKRLEDIYLKIISEINSKKHKYLNIFDIQEKIEAYSKKGNVHTERVKTAFLAYKEYQNRNIKEAVKIIEENIENIKQSKYVYEGEKVFCIKQLEYIKNKILDEKVNRLHSM